MLVIKNKIEGIENIDKVISLIDKVNDNKSFNDYIKDKVKEVLKQVMEEKLVGNTTNEEDVEVYKQRNFFEDTDSGFILYNDSMVYPGERGHQYYPFCIALAFEYGTGIVGASSPKEGHWDYNIKKYKRDWSYHRNGVDYTTQGYEGMEIYRTIKDRVNDNLEKWTKEYFKKEV